MEDTYIKKIGSTELCFLEMAAKAGISPNIISVTKINRDNYRVVMEKYPTTILNYSDEGKDIVPYKRKIEDLVDRLHDLDIIHGDLHGDNIVINPETGEVRLIDFGGSYFYDEITPSILRQLSKFLDKKFKNVDELLDFEKNMYLHL